MRVLPLILLSSVLASACDQGTSAVPKGETLPVASAPSGSFISEDFVADDAQQNGNAVLISSSFIGTSANGTQADLQLRFKINPDIQAAVTPETEVVVSINENGSVREIARQRFDYDAMAGQINVVVEPTTSKANLVVGLDRLNDAVVTNVPAYSTAALPVAQNLASSEFNNVKAMHVQLVPGTYSSEIVGDRREHRFAVRVFADYSDQPVEGQACASLSFSDVETGNYKPVIGLDKSASTNFIAREYGIADVESPVTVGYSKENLAVYLIMDISSSIVESGMADSLLDAVSRSVISLAPFSDFDYRIFGSDVIEIDSLRDINFDDSTGSGTALYYGIDTALKDIEAYSKAEQNKLIITLSDGRDLASRNFYPSLTSHQQVQDYIAERLVNVQEAQNSFYNSQLSSYFVDLTATSGDTAADSGLQALAQASNGNHFIATDKQGLKNSLQTITDHVGGTYDLVYSSQQTPNDTELTLQVNAGRCSYTVNLPTENRD